MMRKDNRLLAIVCALCVFSFLATGAALAQVGQNTRVLNPNLASLEQLGGLPGLDAATARRIVDERPFLTMQAFHDVVGNNLDEPTRQKLYAKLFVPLDLNRATREEILLVPGVGSRMAHEFEEYRPYVKLGQFRREIGKYVDDAEVARLEQFVFVPIDLNTATDEDILSIPGVGKRMLHEFKEYRPYKAMEQFEREIGKYVSDAEVKRLARFVMVK